MSKCIKCGRELTSGEIPEFNYGMCDKCYKDYQCKQYPFKKEMFDMQDEIKQLKQQLAEKDKEIELLKHIGSHETNMELFKENTKLIIEKRQFTIQELEKVNGILTDTIIEVTQNEFDLNKLCYLEEISAKFGEKMQEQIKELKGEKECND